MFFLEKSRFLRTFATVLPSWYFSFGVRKTEIRLGFKIPGGILRFFFFGGDCFSILFFFLLFSVFAQQRITYKEKPTLRFASTFNMWETILDSSHVHFCYTEDPGGNCC